MSLFHLFFFGFIVMWLALRFWNVSDSKALIEPDGSSLARGIKVWSVGLTDERINFFEAMPATVTTKEGIIRKQDREISISFERLRWHSFSRYRHWEYLGYVNLALPERQLELRLPTSVVLEWVLLPLFFAAGFTLFDFDALSLIWYMLLMLPLIFAVLIAFNHWIAYSRINRLLNKAMQSQEQPDAG